MIFTGLKSVEFEGSLIGVNYTDTESGDVVGIPISNDNRDYQKLLDSINTDGAAAWSGDVEAYEDIPEQLRNAAEAKEEAD